jgi:hypothetical protein
MLAIFVFVGCSPGMLLAEDENVWFVLSPSAGNGTVTYYYSTTSAGGEQWDAVSIKHRGTLDGNLQHSLNTTHIRPNPNSLWTEEGLSSAKSLLEGTFDYCSKLITGSVWTDIQSPQTSSAVETYCLEWCYEPNPQY